MNLSKLLVLLCVLSLGLAAACARTLAAEFGAAASQDASQAEPADFNTVVNIGDPAPVWHDLIGVDDQRHSLAELAGAQAVVVVFTCNHCPVAQAYQDRLIQLATDYAGKGVRLVAINVNNLAADKLPKMKERAAKKGFPFPYLYDPTQAIGRAYGATVTPHVFLLNKSRHIVYMGAIDDSQDPTKVKTHYLRDALDALLAGQPPAPAATQQFGCGIKYE